MAANPIPGHVRDFLSKHIDSVAHLEALLLLRQNPAEGWNILQLSKRLYIDESDARGILNSLAASTLVITDGLTFHYLPADSETQGLVDALADTYSRCLVPITKIIHEKGSSVHQFANAFKFRKD